VAHLLDVGTEFFGQHGEFVHEGNTRRQHGVGGVFGEFGALHIHHRQAVTVALERRVQLAQQSGGALAVGADHDAVGFHEVFHRRALLEELRVGRHVNSIATPRFASSSCRAAFTLSAVPTGTVDLSTTSL